MREYTTQKFTHELVGYPYKATNRNGRVVKFTCRTQSELLNKHAEGFTNITTEKGGEIIFPKV